MITRKKNKFCVIICIFVFLFCVINVGIKRVEQNKRYQELSDMHSYEVYSSFVATREIYSVYVMCNTHYSISDVIAHKFTDEYFESLKLMLESSDVLHVSAVVYMMLPSEDLPYGWEMDELNISVNFDQSIFHRHTKCIISIPYGASSIDDCSIEYRKQNGEW